MNPLHDARIQLHWAAQVVSSDADRKLPAQPDDSHTNMEWRDGSLVGQTGLALRLADLTLHRGGETFPLAGRTLAQALDWSGAGRTRDYDMPAHAVQSGGRFGAEPAALAELSEWYAFADKLLRELVAAERKALPVRCWPHHFDLGSISYLDDSPPGEARQLGFGLSPGDSYHADPYWYLTAFPMPVGPSFTPLDGGGVWHRQGFTGAVLVGVREEKRVRAFLVSAFAAGRVMLAGH